jgi:hypothetical protein
VVASGKSPVAVSHAAEATGQHPFIICVGHENEPSRIRRVTSAFDTSYPGEPLPLLRVEFRPSSGSTGTALDRVIPDAGADASVLPWADCHLLQLDPTSGVQGLITGVAGGSAATLAFHIWAWLDGREYPCRVQADFAGHERLLGRDVLNQLNVLFRGPAGELVVNP